ncbi:YicC/YloC family endoribonuclease [Allobacillus sp. GCM10007491]|uniref:YicC family protein n=1 Tax=Allobacillus saliphilus TaxID=2912308 RepID=A0A941HSL0_9BACI|nr:YicC/YloC family endoribonuclease [Allobacillus saliphilus]MBR7552820.1 YicC family protein [Allobacillus saliphilus]
MIKSMTGYGRFVSHNQKRQITIEVKTINHRYLDISCKIPRELYPYENELKKQMKAELSRGRVDVYIACNGEQLTDKKMQVDWGLFDQYLRSIEAIQEKGNIQGSLSIEHILSMENLFYIEEPDVLDEQLLKTIKDGMQEALQQVIEMRTTEGEAIQKDFINRIQSLKSYTVQLEEHAKRLETEQFNSLKEKLEKMLEGQGIDEARIVQEAAIQIEKADIAEELTRLHSHIEQFLETLDKNGPIGRKLDFIAQELLREVNTIASKSILSEVSRIAVEMKSEIEKIKEQVQNIE